MPAVRHQLRRFLFNADKPALLAIARPVTKKNLAAFVCAYGMSPELQEAANLLSLAGHLQSMDELEPECAAHIRAILSLIDEYELYGKVAFPKSHRTENVPAYCAYARETGGVFASPALKEPFGLTLLEASAAGLPIVATDSGGPNDIAKSCENGLLVDPRSDEATADACRQLLGHDRFWRECSENGARAVEMFDWKAHRREYKQLAGRIAERRPRERVAARPGAMLVSDIDNTLLGSSEGLTDFRQWYGTQTDMLFGIATGRSSHSALSILAKAKAPKRRSAVSGIRDFRGRLGNSYRDANEATFSFDRHWADHISAGWNRAEIERVIEEGTSLQSQSPLEQRAFKLSYFVKGGPDAASRLRWLLSKKGLNATR